MERGKIIRSSHEGIPQLDKETISLIDEWRADVARQRSEDARWAAIEFLRLFADELTLTPQERAVWKASCLEHRSSREVQAETGVSKSNVDAVAKRASAKLARSISGIRQLSVMSADQLRILEELESIVIEDDYEPEQAYPEDFPHMTKPKAD